MHLCLNEGGTKIWPLRYHKPSLRVKPSFTASFLTSSAYSSYAVSNASFISGRSDSLLSFIMSAPDGSKDSTKRVIYPCICVPSCCSNVDMKTAAEATTAPEFLSTVPLAPRCCCQLAVLTQHQVPRLLLPVWCPDISMHLKGDIRMAIRLSLADTTATIA